MKYDMYQIHLYIWAGSVALFITGSPTTNVDQKARPLVIT